MHITVRGLSKEYKNGCTALKDVNLDIQSGLFGLLGPNGAGKTTLMKILVTLLKPTGGEVKFNGFDLLKNRRQIRELLGYLPQDFTVFSRLMTWEFLDYSASLAGIISKQARQKAVDEMLAQVGLFDARDRQANKLSGGMKRRLGIAQALIGNPKIIIVDEPTTGLDPEERIRFRNLLSDIARSDVVIILSTNIVGDISSTCHDMALLNKGMLVYNDAPEKLIEYARGHVWQIDANDDELMKIKERYPVIATLPSAAGWEVQIVADTMRDFNGVLIEPNLEHAYVYFMEFGQDAEQNRK